VQLQHRNRFFGLFGIYFSLRYLSLSDAVVLTFLTPFCAGFAASIFLGECFTRKEALASRKYRLSLPIFFLARLIVIVSSLFGVVLIARPAFLFWNAEPTGLHAGRLEEGTSAQRLMAVGCVGSFSFIYPRSSLAIISVALIGVVGSTGAC